MLDLFNKLKNCIIKFYAIAIGVPFNKLFKYEDKFVIDELSLIVS